MQNSAINPFYAARNWRAAHPSRPGNEPVYAKLPRIPINASPVPHLTSLYHSAEAGDYGDRGYPGNCGGKLTTDAVTERSTAVSLYSCGVVLQALQGLFPDNAGAVPRLTNRGRDAEADDRT